MKMKTLDTYSRLVLVGRFFPTQPACREQSNTQEQMTSKKKTKKKKKYIRVDEQKFLSLVITQNAHMFHFIQSVPAFKDWLMHYNLTLLDSKRKTVELKVFNSLLACDAREWKFVKKFFPRGKLIRIYTEKKGGIKREKNEWKLKKKHIFLWNVMLLLSSQCKSVDELKRIYYNTSSTLTVISAQVLD